MAKLSMRQSEHSRDHNTAVLFPRGAERPLVYMLQAWELYPGEYYKATEETLGSSKAKRAWARIGISLIDLIRRFDVGRLNREHLIRFVGDVAKKEGVNLK